MGNLYNDTVIKSLRDCGPHMELEFIQKLVTEKDQYLVNNSPVVSHTCW